MLSERYVLPNVQARRATEASDRVFVRCVGGEDITSGSLETLTQGWMGVLGSQGVLAGDRVVMILPNTQVLPVWMAIAGSARSKCRSTPPTAAVYWSMCRSTRTRYVTSFVRRFKTG